MNERQAILKSADSIEVNPSLFNFGETMMPEPDCGLPGCALGWIALHAGLSIKRRDCFNGRRQTSDRHLIYEFLHITPDICFNALTVAYGGDRWKDSAKKCASALRLYADKYHPETDHIPASVRAIFDVKELVAAPMPAFVPRPPLHL